MLATFSHLQAGVVTVSVAVIAVLDLGTFIFGGTWRRRGPQ